jgi:hypothetical protein
MRDVGRDVQDLLNRLNGKLRYRTLDELRHDRLNKCGTPDGISALRVQRSPPKRAAATGVPDMNAISRGRPIPVISHAGAASADFRGPPQRASAERAPRRAGSSAYSATSPTATTTLKRAAEAAAAAPEF